LLTRCSAGSIQYEQSLPLIGVTPDPAAISPHQVRSLTWLQTCHLLPYPSAPSIFQYLIKESGQVGVGLGAGQQPAVDVESGAKTDPGLAAFLVHALYFGGHFRIGQTCVEGSYVEIHLGSDPGEGLFVARKEFVLAGEEAVVHFPELDGDLQAGAFGGLVHYRGCAVIEHMPEGKLYPTVGDIIGDDLRLNSQHVRGTGPSEEV
jgi:hypothetical protein